MKKALSLILALVLCLSLCACGTGSSSSDQSKKITTHKQALKLVQDGDGFTSARTEICEDLKFREIIHTNWGTCTAGQNSDGTWTVKLCGSMRGYTDNYSREAETYSFDYTVTIDAEGSVKWYQGKTKIIK